MKNKISYLFLITSSLFLIWLSYEFGTMYLGFTCSFGAYALYSGTMCVLLYLYIKNLIC